MLKKILIVILIVLLIFVAREFYYFYLIELSEPVNIINFEEGESINNFIRGFNKDNNLIVGVNRKWPMYLKEFDQEGNIISEDLFRDQDGNLLANIKKDTGIEKEIISENWRGEMGIDSQGNLIFIEPSNKEIIMLDADGFFLTRFNIDLDIHIPSDRHNVSHRIYNQNLYFRIRGDSLGEVFNVRVELDNQRTKIIDKFGPEDQKGNIVYYSQDRITNITGRRYTQIEKYSENDNNEIIASYEFSSSFPFTQWNMGLWDYSQFDNSIYFLDDGSYFAGSKKVMEIKKYDLEQDKLTTFAGLDIDDYVIPFNRLEVREDKLYLIDGNRNKIFIYDIFE